MPARKLVIASNDYRSNVPGSGISAHGGPANFADQMSRRVIEGGHQWIGLVQETDESRKLSSRTLHRSRNRTLIGVGIPKSSADKVIQTKTRRRPDLLAATEIAFVERVLAEVAPDVLFLNGFSAYAWMLFEAALKLGIPIAIQHAGVWAMEVRQYAEHFTPEGRRACYWMERRTAALAASNIFLNQTSKDAFERVLRTASRNATIVPLPDRGWKYPTAASFRPAQGPERIIGVVARWDRIKNHSAVLDFAKAVKRLRLPWKVRSVVAIPPSKMNAALKAEYRKTIDVIAPMGAADLKDFFGSIDALIVPSRFDVSPMVVMEALTQSVPALIAPRVGWASEYRDHGMGEWIVDFNRSSAAVRRLRDHFERGAWPEVARFAKKIESCHNPDTIHETYLRLFRRIASQR